MTAQTGTVTLLVAKSYQNGQEQAVYEQLAETLAARLQQTVIPFPIDQSSQSLSQILTDLLRYGISRLVTLPVFLTPAEYEQYAVADTITYVNRRWPFMQHHLGTPLEWSDWLDLINANLAGLDGRDTAVILAAHDTEQPIIHSDVAKLSRLTFEANDFGWVDTAFVGESNSTVKYVIERYAELGAENIVVIPYMLFNGRAYQKLLAEIDHSQAQGKTELLPCLSDQSSFLERLLLLHKEAVADSSLLAPTRQEIESEIAAAREAEALGQTYKPDQESNEYQQMKSKIEAILPPRYQGRTDEVSAAPMSAADLVFDDEGKVLWDQIFGVDDPNNPYCELALAGGPSHRGGLLKAVSGADCLAEPGKYAAALEECGRGINMITGLQIVEGKTPGWIGVNCDSEQMAIWLMRAIIVENVMVRREGNVIFLPVGPHYTLKDQIKSIVTVTAKTWHYWIEHISFQELFKAAKTLANKET